MYASAHIKPTMTTVLKGIVVHQLCGCDTFMAFLASIGCC